MDERERRGRKIGGGRKIGREEGGRWGERERGREGGGGGGGERKGGGGGVGGRKGGGDRRSEEGRGKGRG